MNGIKFLLDTCFIIQWHAQDPDAFALIKQLDLQPFECGYSDITHAELFGYHGITAKAENELNFLLSDIERLAVTSEIIDFTIKIRKAHKIKLPDALILATAKINKLELLTFDKKLLSIYQT